MHSTRFLVLFILLFTTLSPAGEWRGGGETGRLPLGVQPKDPERSMVMPGRVIVKMRGTDGTGATVSGETFLGDAGRLYGASSVQRMFPSHGRPAVDGQPDLSMMYVMTYASPVSPFAAAAELSRRPEIEYAEPWFVYEISDAQVYTPDDPDFGKQWYLAKVRADSAWEITKGDSAIVIGFVDTGVQGDHPDLQGNMWLNPGENGPDGLGGNRENNGLDDDANGYIDDWSGWDFVGASYLAPAGDNSPWPTGNNNAHGTHVAGIACAVTDNATGIAGTGFHTRILAVKATGDNDTRGPGGTPYIIAGYQGIVYAADNGADVISLSWGGSGYSQAEQEIVNYATSKGALVVAAAGNTGNAVDLQYPASYDNVISVAATNAADGKTGYSAYNERVDVCAPGGQTPTTGLIYSTYYPSTYAYSSGTSMATPLVAGVAALVRAYFPSLSPVQVGEKVRATCDDIYNVNSTYRYKLGKGRVNAYRALTEDPPSVRMISLTASDSAGGNDNNAFEPGEDIDLTVVLKNYLAPTSSATLVTLTSTDPSVVVTAGAFLTGALGTDDEVTNASAPFRVHVQTGIAFSKAVTFTLDFVDGAYRDRQQFTLLFNPTFATHTVNNVWATLTNNGRFGFQNFPTNTDGVGFIYGNGNQLFEGGLIIGTSATKLVDVVRNNNGTQDADFTSSQPYSLTRPGPVADEEGETFFTDAAAAVSARIGIEVTAHSYAQASEPDDDYIISSYAIRNVSGATVTNLYAGMFLDWDVLSPGGESPNYYDTNRTDFDAGRNLGYAWFRTELPTVYVGTVALEGAASYRALLNSLSIDLSRPSKWNWISGGVVPDTQTGDIHFVVSSGPYTIENNATQTVAFAMVGGHGLADLRANADAAAARWAVIKTLTDVSDLPPGIPESFTLLQNYPNPFNPSTTIRFGLPASGSVRLSVYSLLGEEVRSLLAEGGVSPGYHEVVWDGLDDRGRSVATGMYLYRLEYTDADLNHFSQVKNFVLMK